MTRGPGPDTPRILLATTLRWPLAARLAIAFRQLGGHVEAWCPPGHPLEATRAVTRVHRANAFAPAGSLRAALQLAAPDLVVPCDDDAAIQLDGLHRRARAGGDGALAALLERSLGTPAACLTAATRGDLMERAAAAGIRVPATARLRNPADLDAWAAREGFPAVIKVDRTWGGEGVTVVRNLHQARAAISAAQGPSLPRALLQLLLRRDLSGLRRWHGMTPAVTIQAQVTGMPATCAAACWQGEVLGTIEAFALETRTPTGPATVVEVVRHPAMADAARRLVRALGLSGFCGLDFVIESATGAAWLIEMNPRATPVCHLAPVAGPTLAAALCARLAGAAPPAAVAPPGGGIVALFPGEWNRDPWSPYLASAVQDVPWDEPGLVRECVALPWDERGFLARLRARFSPAPLRPAFPAVLSARGRDDPTRARDAASAARAP